jgi:hypothetical protein
MLAGWRFTDIKGQQRENGQKAISLPPSIMCRQSATAFADIGGGWLG